MDAAFWTVVAVAAASLIALWFSWSKTFAQALDLELAADELREAHATIHRQAEVIASFPARDMRGRFAKRAAWSCR